MTLEEQLRVTNENLYKHSHELAVKNKVLEFLGRLYEISALTLTQKQLAEQVALALQTEFDFEIVGIFQYEKGTDQVTPLSIAVSERVYLATPEFIAASFSSVVQNHFLSHVIEKKAMFYSELMESVWNQPELKLPSKKLEEEKFVRSTLGYPLIIGGEVIGLVLISLNRVYTDLIEYEKDSLHSFMNVISVALNRVMLYEALGLANQRQESLLHFITHEVKGYLTKSKAVFAAIIEGDFENVPPALMDIARQALGDTQKGVETVRDILDSSSLKRGTTEYAAVDFDFKKVVFDSVADFQKTAQEKNLTLTAAASEGSFIMRGDEAKLSRHVVRNLIDNAIRYTLNGTIAVALSIREGQLVLEVKDSGVGVAAEDMHKLFTEGGKGADSVRINVDSTGYGLFIAKLIVEAHKGKISVASEGKGKGSTFTVTLPLAS